MNLKELILDKQLEFLFQEGTFGIEKESVRFHPDGRLALTDHPHAFGNRSYHPTIQTDFSESQVEIITPTCTSTREASRQLTAIHDVVLNSLSDDEYLFPFSTPAVLPEDEVDIPIVRVEDQSQITYREGLAERYGKRKQMISGIHFNFGLKPEFFEKLYQAQSDDFKSETSLIDFTNSLYMKMSRNFMRYRWLLTYLFGASPYADESFYGDTKPYDYYVRSVRNSVRGYHNTLKTQVPFTSIEDYADTIYQLIEEGELAEEREFYGSIRARGASSLKEMVEKGIKYIEIRSIDINPYDENGISQEQLDFTHYFALFLMWTDRDDRSLEALTLGTEMNEKSAVEPVKDPSQYKEEGLELLAEMKEMLEDIQASDYIKGLVDHAVAVFENPELTLAARLAQEIEASSFLDWGLKTAKAYKAAATDQPYILRGYEKMELSTQLLMFDAIQKGVELEVLDEADQFIMLTHKDHSEPVKMANKTRLDTYIGPLLMENKTVTKKVLAKAGFSVPGGGEYDSLEAAKAAYPLYQDEAVVIKPKSTNMGIGITVFKEPARQEDYEEALRLAFKEDSAVLVEEFISGTEYRFFTLGGETLAVLLRKPANVMGDGQHTIEELVAEKNEDPLRGYNHRSPLEIIQLGEIEQLNLRAQGLTVDSVPEEGEEVFLRNNSNISTGGDSIDFTDQMDDSYKQIAAGIAEACGANITGVDLIIPDYKKVSTPEDPGYSCIEANFNPAMQMHAYVTEGQGRRLTLHVLDALFPELKIL